jgi:hypothetical protein
MQHSRRYVLGGEFDVVQQKGTKYVPALLVAMVQAAMLKSQEHGLHAAYQW